MSLAVFLDNDTLYASLIQQFTEQQAGRPAANDGNLSPQ